MKLLCNIIYTGKEPLKDFEAFDAFKKYHPLYNIKLWTWDNRIKHPLLEEMIKNDLMKMAAEYYKILILIQSKTLVMEHDVIVTKSLSPTIQSADRLGFCAAKKPINYGGVDYLSTKIMQVYHSLVEPQRLQSSYILHYKENFEHFYKMGERNENFFGDNLFSRVYCNKVLSFNDAYLKPNPRTINFRVTEPGNRLCRFVLPYTAFFADEHEKNDKYVLGYIKKGNN